MSFYGERFRKPDEDDIWEELKYWIKNPITAEEIALRKKEEQEYINSIMNLAFPVDSLKKKANPYLNYEELMDNSSKKIDNTRKLIQYSKEIEYNPNLSTEEKIAKKLEVAQILKESQTNLKNIKKDQVKNNAKNYAGAALQIGSAAIPGISGGKIASSTIKTATPLINQIRNKMLTKSIAEGAISGSVEGLGRGLLENENLIKTSIQDSFKGALGGTILGNVAGKILSKKPKIKNLDELLDKRNDWGIAYTKQSGNPEVAIEKLLEQKKGFVPKAIHKDGIGDIDFVWGKGGKKGFGLSHIIDQRNIDGLIGLDYVKNIPTIIQKGRLQKIKSQPNIDFVKFGNDNSLIKKVWDDKKRNWVVTTFRDRESLNKPTNRTPDIVNNINEMTPSFGLSKDTNIIGDSQSNLNPQTANQTIKAPKSYQEWLEELRRKRKQRGIF